MEASQMPSSLGHSTSRSVAAADTYACRSRVVLQSVTDSLKLLSVTLDRTHAWAPISTFQPYSARLYFHLSALQHIRSLDVSDKVAQQIACSIVGSRLDYCNSLLVNCSNRNLDELQRVQDNLARVVCNSNRWTSAGSLLRSLHRESTSNSPNFVIWLLLSNSQASSLIWSAHTVSLACCDYPHRSFCQSRRTTWTLLLVVFLSLLRDFGTLFHWTVELLHQLTHLIRLKTFLFDLA